MVEPNYGLLVTRRNTTLVFTLSYLSLDGIDDNQDVFVRKSHLLSPGPAHQRRRSGEMSDSGQSSSTEPHHLHGGKHNGHKLVLFISNSNTGIGLAPAERACIIFEREYAELQITRQATDRLHSRPKRYPVRRETQRWSDRVFQKWSEAQLLSSSDHTAPCWRQSFGQGECNSVSGYSFGMGFTQQADPKLRNSCERVDDHAAEC